MWDLDGPDWSNFEYNLVININKNIHKHDCFNMDHICPVSKDSIYDSDFKVSIAAIGRSHLYLFI